MDSPARFDVGSPVCVCLASALMHFLVFAFARHRGWPYLRASSLASLIHAAVTFPVAAASMFPYLADLSLLSSPSTTTQLLLDDTPHDVGMNLSAFSFGYFAYDLLAMITTADPFPQKAAAIVHHLVVMSANLCCHSLRFARPLITMAYFEEFSTLPLNVPQVLGAGSRSRLYRVSRAAFALSFLACRFSVMWVVAANVPRMWAELRDREDWEQLRAPFCAMSALLLATRAVNVFWLALIVRKIIPAPRKLR
jgi:hypothetical protein